MVAAVKLPVPIAARRRAVKVAVNKDVVRGEDGSFGFS
jgi:hypothetical protein